MRARLSTPNLSGVIAGGAKRVGVRGAQRARGAVTSGRWPAGAQRLSPSAERRLVVEAQKHPDRRERLLEAFEPSIARIARLYSRSTPAVGRAELMQEGVVGLLRALDRYDVDIGVPFWAYASWWVRQAMQQLVAELSGPMVLSDRALRQLARIKQAERDCGQRSGRQPGAPTLALETGLSSTNIERLRAAERAAISVDEPAGDDGGGTLADFLADTCAEDPCDVATTTLLAEQLPRLLDVLSERERVVVQARFGFDGPERTLAELGTRLGVSAERVRQVEHAALEKLRERCSGQHSVA
jgi:RNA polymerase primary sigma factor